MITVATQPFLIESPQNYDNEHWNIYGPGFVGKFIKCYEKTVEFLEKKKAKLGVDGIISSEEMIDSFLYGEVWSALHEEILKASYKTSERTAREDFLALCFVEKFQEIAESNNVNPQFPPASSEAAEFIDEAASELAHDLIFEDGTAYMDFFEFAKCVCEKYKLMLYNIYDDEIYMDPQVHILLDHSTTDTFTIDIEETDESIQIDSSNYFGTRSIIEQRLGVGLLDKSILVYESACDSFLFSLDSVSQTLSRHTLFHY